MGHKIDLALECGHIIFEPVEGALDIFHPKVGEVRYCSQHKMNTRISNVGTPFWDEDSNGKEVIEKKERKK